MKSPDVNDICIGSIIGKNPGSALASCSIKADLQKIDLNGDSLLPNVKSIFTKAYESIDIEADKKAYIQVLNLMYICNKDLSEATKKIEIYESPRICNSEKSYLPFAWYLWGNDDKKLNKYKERFSNLNTKTHFYLDTKTNNVVSKRPSSKDSARHTQGMKHDLVVPYIAAILKELALKD